MAVGGWEVPAERWLLLLLILATSMVTQVVTTDPCTRAERACARAGTKLAKLYLRKVKKEEKINFCVLKNSKENQDFQNCVRDLKQDCAEQVLVIEERYGVLNKTLDGACGDARTVECERRFSCFAVEYNSIFWQHCEFFSAFNIKHAAKEDKCYFHKDGIDCRKELVTSACGHDVASLAMELLHHELHRELQSLEKQGLSCGHQHQYTFDNFHYNDGNCTPGRDQELITCENNHLKNKFMKFHDLNDLVVDKMSDIEGYCRRYKKYRRCIRTYKQQCPRAVDIFYEYDSDLRTYLHKMHYICSKRKSGYTRSLPCIQQVARNSTVTKHCGDIWNRVQPLLKVVNPMDYFCRQEQNSSQELYQGLDDLRDCYTTGYNKSCGSEAADIMDHMTKRAFADPHYLQYEYKPNCNLPLKPDRATGPDNIKDVTQKPQTRLKPTAKGADRTSHMTHKPKGDNKDNTPPNSSVVKTGSSTRFKGTNHSSRVNHISLVLQLVSLICSIVLHGKVGW